MSLVVAVLGAVALLLVPGALVALALRLRGLWFVAALAPLSIAFIGVAPVLTAWMRVPFAFWHPAALALIAAVAIEAVRRPLARRGRWPRLGRWERTLPVTGIALVAGAVVVTLLLLGITAPAGVSQTYDGIFHLNAVAWILDTGDGSSLHLYRITHPGDGLEFYPAAWHDLVAGIVQLTGGALTEPAIPVATNAAWLATTWLVWMPSAALLTRVVAGRTRGIAVEAVAALLSAVAGAMPWLLLGWGTLYPTGVATALLPFGLALAVTLLRRGGRRHLPTVLVLAALWFAACGLAHPRSLVSVALLVAPLVLFALIGWARRTAASRRGRRIVVAVIGGLVAAVIAVVAVGAIYVYRNFDVANRPISDHLNGGPATATRTLGEALLQAIGLAAPLPDSPGTAAPQLALALALLVGVVIAARSRRMRWLALAWVIAVVLYAAAAGSNSDLAKVLTGVWYKDKFRLFVLLAVVGIPLAAVALHQVGTLVPRLAERLLRREHRGSAADDRDRARSALRIAAVLVLTLAVAVPAAIGPGMRDLSTSTAREFALNDQGFLGRADYRLLERLPELVPAGETVAGDPWDGSTLTWALGEREALFPHLAGLWTPDQLTVAQRLDQAAVDPEVCAALDRLDVRFVFHSPGFLWGAPAEAAGFAGIDRAVTTPGVLTPVANDGASTLYRVSACDGAAEQ
ncbi:hypothetical protein GCM10027515_01440 [Schumannella luteola]|uniref:Uncharacterized protein n=1 Tax=Schumannella luteola TaxID=472059 RepID=A0A852Y6Y0_9MICO|nr:DUF6541 family protein [Schumannella luteola]NYG98716.1 hypothetical protein [Schumannella luteola]TPX04300.1 hypothetical protein FJ656_12625 [Schumannella luteola]